ncbi:MAG: PAS-domain containing protein [Pseudomonadota bacterium]
MANNSASLALPSEGAVTASAAQSPLSKLDRMNAHATEQILEQVGWLNALREHFPGGIALFDDQLRLVFCNDGLKRLLGYPETLFANGMPSMEDLFRFNAGRGEYGAVDIEKVVADKMALAKKRLAHRYDRERPNGTVLEVRGQPLDGGGFVTTYLDVTDQRRRVRQLEALLVNFPGGIALFDRHLNMTLCNDELKRLLDYPEELFADGMPSMEDLFRFNAGRGEYGDGDQEKIVADKMALADLREPHHYERERPDGTVLEVRGHPLKCGGFVTTYLDATEQRQRVRQLEALLNNFPGGISLFDRHLNMVLCNDELKRLLDYPEEMFDGRMPTMEELFRFNAQRGEYGAGEIEEIVAKKMALAEQRQSHQYERKRPNGNALEVRGEPLPGSGFITTYLDVTERRETQEAIAHMAHHDALTGLPNRFLFLDRLRKAISSVGRGQKLAVHYVDLDKFKPVNDTFGHKVGDELLKAVADRMKKAIRHADTVARLGGDEFVILQLHIENISDAEALAGHIIKAVTTPFEILSHTIEIGTSIGTAFAPDHGDDVDTLLNKADKALYKSKENGRGRHFTFDPSME